MILERELYFPSYFCCLALLYCYATRGNPMKWNGLTSANGTKSHSPERHASTESSKISITPYLLGFRFFTNSIQYA